MTTGVSKVTAPSYDRAVGHGERAALRAERVGDPVRERLYSACHDEVGAGVGRAVHPTQDRHASPVDPHEHDRTEIGPIGREAAVDVANSQSTRISLDKRAWDAAGALLVVPDARAAVDQSYSLALEVLRESHC